MKAKIHVTLKSGILDPQGKAIEHALESLGFNNTANAVSGVAPGGQLPTTFGQFTGAGLARRMQLGLRVDF